MKLLLIIAALSTTPLFAAGEYTVFNVRTDFPMTDGERAYRDIYVNIGTKQGIKVGSKLDVFRVLTTVDEINQKNGRNISFKIGELKVIHSDSDISVARISETTSPEKTPIGIYTNVMVGDHVEASSR